MHDPKNKQAKKRRWLWVIGGVLLFIGLWQLVANFYLEEEKELRRQLRETIKERFPDQTAQIYKTFGLFPFKGNREDAASQASVQIFGLESRPATLARR